MSSIQGAHTESETNSRTRTLWFNCRIHICIRDSHICNYFFFCYGSNWRNGEWRDDVQRISLKFAKNGVHLFHYLFIYLLCINFSSFSSYHFKSFKRCLAHAEMRYGIRYAVCTSDINMKWLNRFVFDISKLRQNERSLVYVTLLNNELISTMFFFRFSSLSPGLVSACVWSFGHFNKSHITICSLDS